MLESGDRVASTGEVKLLDIKYETLQAIAAFLSLSDALTTEAYFVISAQRERERLKADRSAKCTERRNIGLDLSCEPWAM